MFKPPTFGALDRPVLWLSWFYHRREKVRSQLFNGGEGDSSPAT